MRVLTDIGEVGITFGGRTHVVRPSFYSMSQIGTPAEIVEAYAALFSAPALTGKPWADKPRLRRWGRDRLMTALTVMYACADPVDDLGPLLGGVSERMGYQPGAMPIENIIALARALMRHGIVGDVSTKRAENGAGDYSSTFKARDYVASAMAHLGASEADAWNMTMTSFLAAMRAKYPPTDAKGRPINAPTSEQHDATMDWLARVNAARRKANG